MKKPDTSVLVKKFTPFINFLKKDAIGIFLFIVAAVFAFLIWRIGNLAGATPSQDAIDEKLQGVIRPKIDPDSIKKIEELQAQNVNIQSYFVDRDNPFQE